MQKISLFIPKFGISINAALFADRQSRLYNWLFGKSDRVFHINELRRLTGLGSASFQRELKRLATAGLIETQAVGQSASFSGESSIARFTELVALTRKTLDVVPVLGDVLTTLLPGLQSACVYGSVAKQTDTARSDIDVMLIGNAYEMTCVGSQPNLVTAGAKRTSNSLVDSLGL